MSHRAMNWALEQRHLKPGPWVVLIQLADRHNKDTKLCRPEQVLLAHDCNMSRATLNRHLAEIEAAGLIQRVARQNPATKKQLATQYILGIDYDDPPDVDFAVSQFETRDFEGQTTNRAGSRVQILDAEPCLKNDQSRVSKNGNTVSQIETPSNPVREPKREPCARGARGAGLSSSDRGAEQPAAGDFDADEAFAEFWAVYPKPEEEPAARRAWRKAATAENVDAIIAAAKAYHDDDRVKRGFAKLPANWLLDRCWTAAKTATAAPKTVDLDALAALWAPKLAAGGYIAPSAIGPALARHMLERGLASAAELRRVGAIR